MLGPDALRIVAIDADWPKREHTKSGYLEKKVIKIGAKRKGAEGKVRESMVEERSEREGTGRDGKGTAGKLSGRQE